MSASSPDTESAVDQQADDQTTETQVTVSGDTTAATPTAKAPEMLDAVKAALKPEATPASQTPESEADPDDPDKSKDEPVSEEDEKPSDEEKKNWSERTQRRFRKLTSEVKAREDRLAAITPRAESYDRIEGFVRQNGLTDNDVNLTLQLAANVRNDPVAAFNQLLPVMQHLERVIGNVVPKELQQRVQQGHLSPDDAVALSRASADAALTKQRLERQQADFEQQQQRQTIQSQLDTTVSEVEKWEARAKSKDPDWHLKVGEVQELVELNIARKQRENPSWFPTAQESVQLSEGALKTVNDRLKRFTPRPTEIRPVHTDGPASNRSAPAPKSTLDVIKNVLGR